MMLDLVQILLETYKLKDQGIQLVKEKFELKKEYSNSSSKI